MDSTSYSIKLETLDVKPIKTTHRLKKEKISTLTFSGSSSSMSLSKSLKLPTSESDQLESNSLAGSDI